MNYNRLALVAALFLLILIAGSLVRLYPTILSDRPLKYDSYYHVRYADLIKDTNSIPMEEPWPYPGRDHIYPPLYHMLIAGISILSGVASIEIIRFLLPLFASLTIIPTYFLARKFRNTRTALLTSFFIAISAFLITASYDSPEVIALFLMPLIVFLLLRERYIFSSILLALVFALNTFAAIYLSLVLLIFLLSEKKLRAIGELAIFPLIFCALWYLPRLTCMECIDAYFGSHFVGRTIGYWVTYYAPVILGPIIACFGLMSSHMDKYRKFWIIWTVFFSLAYFSFLLTNAFHPWRMPTYLAFGFSFLLADVLISSKHRWKELFTAFFIFAFISTTYVVYTSGIFIPPLWENEYESMNYIQNQLPQNALVLSEYTFCSNMMTYTDKQCLLDLNLEYIVDKQAAYDYQNYFWTDSIEEMNSTLNKYEMTHVIYSSNDMKRELTDQLDVDKVYASWSCDPSLDICLRDLAIYKVNRG